MLKVLISIALAAVAMTAAHAQPDPSPASQPAKKATVLKGGTKTPFGLTESLAVLFVCPEARFEQANLFAMGAVLQENKARMAATAGDQRMAVMKQLIDDETVKMKAYVKATKVNCATDPERAATYWNKLLARIGAEQNAVAPALHPSTVAPAASSASASTSSKSAPAAAARPVSGPVGATTLP